MKKALSIILALIMVLSTIPFAYAAENTVINEDEELAITIYNKGDSYILFTPERTGTYYIRALGAGLARCYIYNEENEYVCGSGEGESHGCCFRMYSELEAGVTYKLRIWSYSEQMDVVCIISCKHDYQLDESQSNPGKCKFVYVCSLCEKQYIEAKPCHVDENNDSVCDACGKDINGYYLTEEMSETRYWLGMRDEIKDEVEELEFFYNTDEKSFDVYRNKILYFSYDISDSSLYNGNLTYYPQEEIHESYPWEIMAVYVAQPGRMFVPPKPMTSEISTSDYWLSSNDYEGELSFDSESGIAYLIGECICPLASYDVNTDTCTLSTWYYEMCEAIDEYEGKELDYTFEQVEDGFLYTFHDAINPPVPKSEGRSILVKKSADETVVYFCSQMYIETDEYLFLPTATVYNTENGNYLLISLDETSYNGEKHGVYIESSKFESLLNSLSLKFYAPIAHVNEDGNKLCDICGDYVEFTIKCYLNSKEHQYAIEKGYTHSIIDSPDYICNPTSGQCGDNAYWNYDETTKTLYITGEGPMWSLEAKKTEDWGKYRYHRDYYYEVIGYYDFKTDIEHIVIGDDITKIGNASFYGMSAVKDIHIGKGVEEIGIHAFGETLYLESIVIPGNVKKIGMYAFDTALGLKNVILEEGVETIEELAFNSLLFESIVIPSTVTEMDRSAFYVQTGEVNIINNSPTIVFGNATPEDDFTFLTREFAEYYSFVLSLMINSEVNGIDLTMEEQLEMINEKFGYSFLNVGELQEYFEKNQFLAENTYPDSYVITCLPGSAQHEECKELGIEHYFIDFTCDSECGIHASVSEYNYFAPTCTENGYEGGKVCTVCLANATTPEEEEAAILEAPTVIPATGHSLEKIEGIAPTCTSTGLTDGVYCKNCYEIISAQEEIPALTHTDTNSDGICDNCGRDMGTTDVDHPSTPSFGERITNFFRGIVNAILELFKRIFG